MLGGTPSEAGAAIGDVVTRRIVNHLSGPLYPNSYRYLPCPPGIQDYDKEEHLTKQVNFEDRTGGMPRLRAEIPQHGDGRTGNREYVNKAG